MGKMIGFDGLLYLDGIVDYAGDDYAAAEAYNATYIGKYGNQVWDDWGCVGTPPP